MTIMNKELIKLIFKILLYIITAIAGFFGVSSLASCSSSRAVIVTTDSTFVEKCRDLWSEHGFACSRYIKG